MAEDVGDAEPIPDATVGRQQMAPQVEAFERHVLGPDDHGVPGLIQVLDGVDQCLDVLLDGDAADVDHHLVLGCQAKRRLQLVAIDQRVDSAGVGTVGNDHHVVADVAQGSSDARPR